MESNPSRAGQQAAIHAIPATDKLRYEWYEGDFVLVVAAFVLHWISRRIAWAALDEVGRA
jgi:hypothetical protein